MKTIPKTATIKKAFGKVLKPSIDISYSFDAYETITEMRAANDLLSDREQVAARNRQLKGKARQAEQTRVLAAAGIVEDTIQNSPLKRLQVVADAFMANGMTEAAAKEAAAAALNLSWTAKSVDVEDDDEDEDDEEAAS